MGGCSYQGCKNRSENGYQMCVFPCKDQNRRSLWLKNCKYKINNPESPNIKLCHEHFEDKMWCILGPNKRRLKPDAYPTIFNCMPSSQVASNFNSALDNLKENSTAELQNMVKLVDQSLCIQNENYTTGEYIAEEGHNKSLVTLPESDQMTESDFNEENQSLQIQNESSLMNVDCDIDGTQSLIKNIQITDNNDSDIQEVSLEPTNFEMQSVDNYLVKNDFLSKAGIEIDNQSRELHSNKDSANLSQLWQQLLEMKKKQKKLHEEMKQREHLSNERISKLDKMLAKESKSKEYFKNKYYSCLKRLQKYEQKVSVEDDSKMSILRETLSKRFSSDQVEAIIHSHRRFPKWGNETLMLGYRLRFICGSAGYDQLLKEKFPLPSIRTLTRHVEGFKFPPGVIADEVINFLKIKMNHADNVHRHCVLILDEMKISPMLSYDPSLDQIIGFSTLKDKRLSCKEKATHGLVFILAGICARWKQIIRYDYTGDSIDEHSLKNVIEDIVMVAEKKINLLVHVVTSDMGPANQAVWRIYQITAGRFAKTINSIPHPADKDRKLYFYGDSPHILKNMNAGLQANEVATLPDDFVKKYNLPSNKFNIKHLQSIVDIDKENDYKLSPKLKEEDLKINDNHFSKMRVGKARAVLCESNTSALEFLAYENPFDERLSTALMLKQIYKWFDAMCSRNINLALSYKDRKKYDEQIHMLKEAIEFISNLRVGDKGDWKPWQKGLIISTTTVIELSHYLLNLPGELAVKFFLPSRLTQDCIENLFSVMRSKTPVPNSLQFRQNLKLITISQFIRTVSNSNYEEDDRSYLSGFLDMIESFSKPKPTVSCNQSAIASVQPTAIDCLNLNELNVLYWIAGYVIHEISYHKNKFRKACENCLRKVVCHKPQELLPHHAFADTKSKNVPFQVTWVTEETFEFFKKMDSIFRMFYIGARDAKVPLRSFFLNKFLELPFDLPRCHKLKEKIAIGFFSIRIKIKSKKLDINFINDSKKQDTYASKTVAMHSRIR